MKALPSKPCAPIVLASIPFPAALQAELTQTRKAQLTQDVLGGTFQTFGTLKGEGQKPRGVYLDACVMPGKQGASLFERLEAEAGPNAVEQLVDCLQQQALSDPALSGWEAHDAATLVEFFRFLLGGPSDYRGRTMKQAHPGVGPQQFLASVQAFERALQSLDLPTLVYNEALTVFQCMGRDFSVTRIPTPPPSEPPPVEEVVVEEEEVAPPPDPKQQALQAVKRALASQVVAQCVQSAASGLVADAQSRRMDRLQQKVEALQAQLEQALRKALAGDALGEAPAADVAGFALDFKIDPTSHELWLDVREHSGEALTMVELGQLSSRSVSVFSAASP